MLQHTRRVIVPLLAFGLTCLALAGGREAAPQKQPENPSRLLARIYNSGFDLAHDSYNVISAASD